MTIAAFITGLLLGLLGGAYLWYRFGATLATDAQKIKQMKL